MDETWTIGEIVLCGFAAAGCIFVAVLFFMGLNIPPECCAPYSPVATTTSKAS